ncbi:hypothetical protein ACFY20_45535 [Streptomyces sp. NPDC001312]|uniref:hypothetical protein n=1 Tax=Streptomyces sp. NPDC001312 TaxID=3364561 RepID=UPI0036A291BE
MRQSILVREALLRTRRGPASWRPDGLPHTLGRLLGGAAVGWHPPGTPPTVLDPAPCRLVLRDSLGGTLTADRPALPFTRLERLGARLLTMLAPGGVRASWPGGHLRLPGDEAIALRAVRRSDRRAVAALHAACAPLPVSDCRAAAERLVSPRMGCGLLAETPGRRPVAFAGLLLDGEGAELALLIGPAWSARGLGDVLLAELLDAARLLGVREVCAHTGSSGDPVEAAACRVALPVAVARDAAGSTFTIRLADMPQAPPLQPEAGVLVYRCSAADVPSAARFSPASRDSTAKPSSVPGQ